MVKPVSSDTLTDTSHAVLGLIDQWGPSTPYQLKNVAAVSVQHFWTIPHTQIYSECRKLAEVGLLDERREETGRRRRTYRLTAKGRKELERWLGDPRTEYWELRDPGLLKLFAGAEVELEVHDGMHHVFQAEPVLLPEAASALEGIGAFLAARSSG